MTLKKLALRPGVNRENTRYTSENGWYAGDKIRFRQGTPEKIGGWVKASTGTFLGVCRALFGWVTLAQRKLVAVGTNLKYYVYFSGGFNDVTPLRRIATLTDPFTTETGSTTVLVEDIAHGGLTGDFVTFSGASSVGGITLSGEYQITVVNPDFYEVVAASPATSDATGGGSVTAEYQINIGLATQSVAYGWGAGAYGSGTWGGAGAMARFSLRLWSQSSFGEDLIFCPRNGAIYYWDASAGLTNNRAVALASMMGASDVPVVAAGVLVSDVSRFVFAFGCNELGDLVQDPLLIRWSDQEDATNWTPAATNQAGGLRLSRGSEIIAYLQTRQEVLVWTDTSLYSVQYVGAPIVWGATIMADNISIAAPNSVAVASGVTYWMGVDKFYLYNGQVATLNCDLRQYVFSDINLSQSDKIFAGTNEGFNEVWWFYCSSNSTEIDRYVIYNYAENIWYYGTMNRTAWLDSGLLDYPLAAYQNILLDHEVGTDDVANSQTLPIYAYIESAEFDIDDGDRFGFVYRMLPDITFRNSTNENPSVTMTLIPMKNSGSGYGTSVGGSDNAAVTRSVSVPIEEFTGQVFVRVRGRQLIVRVESSTLGTAWQLGSPRIDIRPDGRRG